VLQALATWREQTAQRQNRPRNWVCKDDVLIDMAKLMPNNEKELSHIRGIGEGFVGRFGKKLLTLIKEAKDTPPQPIANYKIKPKLSSEESALVDAMSAIVSLCAQQNQLHPSAIGSRRTLESFIKEEQDCELFHGWRRKIAGEKLLAFFRGDLTLRVDSKSLKMETKN
jgi:ribonuclease D